MCASVDHTFTCHLSCACVLVTEVCDKWPQQSPNRQPHSFRGHLSRRTSHTREGIISIHEPKDMHVYRGNVPMHIRLRDCFACMYANVATHRHTPHRLEYVATHSHSLAYHLTHRNDTCQQATVLPFDLSDRVHFHIHKLGCCTVLKHKFVRVHTNILLKYQRLKDTYCIDTCEQTTVLPFDLRKCDRIYRHLHTCTQMHRHTATCIYT